MRGRNRNNKGPNPLTRSYESNGPDVKIRGTAQHIAEKYSQLARDAQSSGDPVAAENYLQHAEHYYRIIAAAQEQLREQYGYQRPFDEEGDEEGGFAPGDRGYANGEDGDFGQQPQPFEARPFENRQGNGDNRGDDERGDRQDRGERPQRFDRGDRQDRGDRPNRFNRDRQDRGPDNRQDRGPRQDYRQDNRQDNRQDRGDRPDFRDERQDRPDRGDRQDNRGEGRQDFQREDRRDDRGERQERGDRPERAPRQDRGERNGRDFRRERREEPAAEETGLPAFLTNPVRAPVAIESGAPEAAAEAAINGAPAAEGNGEYPRRRRRRTTRGFGNEAGAEADCVPEVETPPAE
jgi:hypothetical protein